jgi:ABC-type transport system involved in multi-copper enzyme maturation permease subunit
MTVLPVIGRELRAAARSSFSYYLRVLGVMALLIVLVLPGVTDSLGPGDGGKLFAYFHCALFFAIWFLVPLLAADAISRERREGTLPLLFLTPLKPRGIVLGKGMVHALRAFMLWLAVLPVLTVCLLLGGVGWFEVFLSELVTFSSVGLALAAGVVASAASKSLPRALACALALAVLLNLAFLLALRACLALAMGAFLSNPQAMPDLWDVSLADGLAMAINTSEAWQQMENYFQGTVHLGLAPLICCYTAAALLSLLGALLAGRFAAWLVSRTWREQPPSPRVLWLRERLCRPFVFQNLLRRWLRWELQHNPIGWLEQRSWSGRLVAWSCFAIIMCAYSSLFANMSLYKNAFGAVQNVLASILGVSIAMSAAGSFRRERESGVLELLLVAPLRESQIIIGRVRGLWGQFIPASVLLCAVWLYCATFLSTRTEVGSVLRFVVTFITLPVVGLYFSLACGSFIAALLWTLLAEFGVPAALVEVVNTLHFSPPAPGNSDAYLLAVPLIPSFVQILLALFLGWRLHGNLRRRNFAFEARRL